MTERTFDHTDGLPGPLSNDPADVHVINQGFNVRVVNDGVAVNIDGQTQALRVKVIEFDMSFWKLVVFLVKVSFAILPALAIVVLAQVLLAAFFTALLLGR
jgi:hypothetical protein